MENSVFESAASQDLRHVHNVCRADIVSTINSMSSNARRRYHGPSANHFTQTPEMESVMEALLRFGRPRVSRVQTETGIEQSRQNLSGGTTNPGQEDLILEMKLRVEHAMECLEDRFPGDIWHCCKTGCFANLAISSDRDSFMSFSEVLRIHKVANGLYRRIGDELRLVSTRRQGVGCSNMAFSAASRLEREGNRGTDREEAFKQLRKFVEDVLPFLLGQSDSPTGRPRLQQKLCTKAVCLILGVSFNFLYKRISVEKRRSDKDKELMDSIIDSAGLRQRQYRRLGLRNGYPEISSLPSFDCGCEVPCFEGCSLLRLEEWWEGMKQCAGELRSRQKENKYLIEVMHCPLMNTSVNICNNALSALFTVSVQKIASVRRVLHLIYRDSTINTQKALQLAEQSYTYSGKHPMNRYSDAVREKIEVYLDMLLRSDPGASDGKNVCRVYSPEINTQEKLRSVLAKYLEADAIVSEPLSSSTLQRMIANYLDEKGCVISLTQSDHNACPCCKTMQYALLQYSYEVKLLKARISALETSGNSELQTNSDELPALRSDLRTKQYQEASVLEELKTHNERDARIRGFLKKLTDYFRKVERTYSKMGKRPQGWCSRRDHAILTHQDDMTKVDLPSFVINASSDITRWRYDINAHVNAVDGECVVFSHEQGAGAKNASSIMELILLDHLIRCRGEGIKIIVSDNAAVGKNWLTTIALPQYMVDQGLAEVVLIVYLENNHGKWLADMLFGQLQIRRRRTTLTGVDALLSEFESLKRSDGSVQGFVVNPLSSVDFAAVLKSLGYSTTPPKDFNFTRRNIHFAGACSQNAKRSLPGDLRALLEHLLPDDEGMVRVQSYPEKGRQEDLPFEKKHFDVPASAECNVHSTLNHDVLQQPPVVVATDQRFASSGKCVVSSRNVDHVGYNGFVFRKHAGYPELRMNNSRLVKESWPAGMLKSSLLTDSEELIPESEALKCAPDNWVVRRPVSRFRNSTGDFVARYPPKNLLNAKFKQGPRSVGVPGSPPWIPASTYDDSPMPLYSTKTWSDQRDGGGRETGYKSGEGLSHHFSEVCSRDAFEDLRLQYPHLHESLNVLDVLRAVYSRMPTHEGSYDAWMQNRCSIPPPSALERYHDGIALFSERFKGYPKASRTVRWYFNRDEGILQKVRQMREGRGHSQASDSKLLATLFEQESQKPGELARFERLAAQDLERYASELKFFKEVTLKQFDAENFERIRKYG